MSYNEDSSASGHDEPWIQWFCGLKGHEMFCHVERAYIEDGFNLYGLRACVSNYSDCLDLILDRIGPEDSDDSHLTQSACTLYGLIHARYIVTTHGLDSMYNKYAAKEFGVCPLIQCNGQPVLPVGLRDEIGIDTAKVFCPKCKNVYLPPSSSLSSSSSRGGGGGHDISSGGGGGGGAVDGAAFGTTFPHLFLMTFNNLVPDPHPPDSIYIPRVFGFRVHRTAHRGSGGAVAVAVGGGAITAGGNNGRKVVGVGEGARGNMTTSTRTASTGGGGGDNGVPPVQEISNGSMKVELKVGGDGKGEDEAKAEAADEQKSIIKVDNKKMDDVDTEVAAAVEEKECAIDETATAATNKREKGETSDRSSSNTSKRQRRSVEAVN